MIITADTAGLLARSRRLRSQIVISKSGTPPDSTEMGMWLCGRRADHRRLSAFIAGCDSLRVPASLRARISFSHRYLFKSCFLAQILDRQECKSLKHKHLVLTQSHKATESGRHFRVSILRVLVPWCEDILWLRPSAARPRWALHGLEVLKSGSKSAQNRSIWAEFRSEMTEKRWERGIRR